MGARGVSPPPEKLAGRSAARDLQFPAKSGLELLCFFCGMTKEEEMCTGGEF